MGLGKATITPEKIDKAMEYAIDRVQGAELAGILEQSLAGIALTEQLKEELPNVPPGDLELIAFAAFDAGFQTGRAFQETWR